MKITKNDLLMAAEWLDCYSTEPDSAAEKASCERVAYFLRKTVETAQFEAAVRQVAKEAGCTTKQARAALRRAA